MRKPTSVPSSFRGEKGGRQRDKDKEGTTQLDVSKYSHNEIQTTENNTDEST